MKALCDFLSIGGNMKHFLTYLIITIVSFDLAIVSSPAFAETAREKRIKEARARRDARRSSRVKKKRASKSSKKPRRQRGAKRKRGKGAKRLLGNKAGSRAKICSKRQQTSFKRKADKKYPKKSAANMGKWAGYITQQAKRAKCKLPPKKEEVKSLDNTLNGELTAESLFENFKQCVFGKSRKPKKKYSKKQEKKVKKKIKSCQKKCDKQRKAAGFFNDDCGRFARSYKDEVTRIRKGKTWKRSFDRLTSDYHKCLKSGKTVKKCFKACEKYRTHSKENKFGPDLLNQDCEHIRDAQNYTRKAEWKNIKKTCLKSSNGPPFKDKAENTLCCSKLNEAVAIKGVALGLLAAGAGVAVGTTVGPAIVAGATKAATAAVASAAKVTKAAAAALVSC